MTPSTPQYELYVRTEGPCGSGRWQFRLQRLDAGEQIEVSDAEPRVRGERLELLTLVRALETLDQPSRVSLVGGSDSLRKGLEYGLPEWRENGWRWEFFGQMVPVKNGDLWQRLDRALRFHRIDHRQLRFDPPHTSPEGARGFSDLDEFDTLNKLVESNGWAEWAVRGLSAMARAVVARVQALAAQFGYRRQPGLPTESRSMGPWQTAVTSRTP